jgi:hypothetical protein
VLAIGEGGRQVILQHEQSSFTPQEANSADFALIQQHLRENRVIGGGGQESAATGEPLSGARGVIGHDGRDVPREDVPLRLCQPVCLVLGHAETGIDHPQGSGDVLGKIAIETFAGDRFHDGP